MIRYFIRKSLRKALRIMTIARERSASTTYLDPQKLVTSNRKDLYYGQLFLKEVWEQKKMPEETLYYYFSSDKDAEMVYKYGARELVYPAKDKNKEPQDFIELYKDIKENGLKKPLLVRRYKSKYIKVVYSLKNKKYWGNIKNETGYQLVDGNHRLTIVLYLGYKKIPVKIFSPWFAYPPDHTGQIIAKEKEYVEKMKNAAIGPQG